MIIIWIKPQLNWTLHSPSGWFESIYKISVEMLIVFRSVVALCAVKLIECMVVNSMRMVWFYAVLSCARNDQIDSMQCAAIDHFHCVSTLETIHIECVRYLMVLKSELSDLDSPQRCKRKQKHSFQQIFSFLSFSFSCVTSFERRSQYLRRTWAKLIQHC